MLGNQLHNIAVTLSHAHRIGGFAFIPAWAYRKVFDCRIPTGYSTEGMEIFRDDETTWNPIPPRGDIILRGSFQSCRLIEESAVRKAIRFHPKIVEYVRERHPVVLEARTTSVHVRRGDSIAPGSHMAVLAPDYYERAMERIPETETFVVFSDDIEWSRSRFRGPRFHFMEKEEDFVDMCAMSMCGNHIIANSTFSWWAAWLDARSEKKVVAPRVWYRQPNRLNALEVPDRLPPDWIVLE